MKTAISLPDHLFDEIDAYARKSNLSRSGVLAAAAREFLRRHGDADSATQAWNNAIRKAGQPGSDPAAAAFRKRTKAVVGKSGRSRR